ncbi:reductive dehalogenase [Dehalogenimonas formicexedens]|uniref:Reductive dehalogenase n=1 Tax=Dehalogenimonas formicexedens TaxID=1839801 RepID=A0A1P8F8Y0_9CHLR|nr:reductive dehalogenase [Dehalogenimonas formicexedens]APV44924.1 reductive dehalogenase [Dehalogenimonas formicexedens]
MATFHSTLSRREFMKGLGLTGAGLGAAALVAPNFHDLDELASSADSHPTMPWWVKTREHEDITNEIDWDTFKAYDKTANPFPVVSAENVAMRAERDKKFDNDGIVQNLPGRNLRAVALADMVTGLQTAPPWDGPEITSPQSKGYTAWQDTPENNLQMVRAAVHLIGSNNAGALALNEHMLRIFDKGAISWEAGIDKGTLDSKKVYHIPDKCKYMLTYSIQQNYTQAKYQLRWDEETYGEGKLGQPMPLGRPTVHRAYGDGRYSDWMALRFVKNLGYGAYKAGVTANVALGIFSGLGEQGRSTYMMSPRNGLMNRITNYVITDLPLAATPPIDFGASKFCPQCKICAERCPSNAMSMESETTWDYGPGNRPGYKGWRMDWIKCQEMGAPSRCGVCHTLCPFNNPSEGIIHPVIRMTAANTGVFNKFFGEADRYFGYATPKTDAELEGWWTRDLSSWKGDVIHGTGQYKW